ncbi:TRAP transporter small permease [Cetobacterium somerae]|uniref:TRAP transporter small permease n=1 Tax=Cetobacterium sp. TaxID=2071632 RepID=UPI001F066B57|nr:TRAP transporter small permease [Cetobacterium somerae]UPO98336.1 TRAP transporter small permease [Cetobacterium somerae]
MNIKRILDNLEEIVGAILFIMMFAILVAQIIFRQIFDSPLVWSEELAILLFTYVGMLGVSIGIKYRQHVFIDFLYNKFSGKGLKIANTFIQSVVFISLVAMIQIGYKLFLRKKIFQLIALKISAGWMYGALPLIATLMLIRFFQVLREDYKEGKFIISPKHIETESDEKVVSKEC